MSDIVAARRYLATALGGTLRAELSAEYVGELWDATDEDLREVSADGEIVLWARSADGSFRLAPIHFRRLDESEAS